MRSYVNIGINVGKHLARPTDNILKNFYSEDEL
jgi:hypothetical protein